MFQYCNECSDLIGKDYILIAKRKYHGTEDKLNDLIELESKIIEAQDTTSKWYNEFYNNQFSQWSISEIARIRSDHYYLDKSNLNSDWLLSRFKTSLIG